MSLLQGITTFTGALLFPLFLRLFWGKLTNIFGTIGGWIAALLIVGGMWVVNHGTQTAFIYQSSVIWIDMGLAAFVGVFTASALKGGKIKPALPVVLSGFTGAFIAGYLMSLLS
ncbi:Lin0368 family putative glycerol transporter subunit [Lacticigenium naphthae]|uniref:Lin0368 family putative glycerol transporter subunit n=1 Tax=Lacticigenium naphthae TaxID=515351 RepID=UPI00040D8002|nr:hypothetical protein [Lacticigenium naphthae]